MVFRSSGKKGAGAAPIAFTLQEQSIEIDGQNIAYFSAGPAAKTVVFVHGNSSCKAAFEHQFLPILEAGYGIMALDLPGHGASSDARNPLSDYTIPSYAVLIRSLCDHLEIKSPLLCGWSLGGHIAIEMAGAHDDYAGLMIFGTPPAGPGLEHLLAAFLPSDVADVTGAESPPQDRLEAYINAVYGKLDPVPDALRSAGFRADGRSRAKMAEHWASGQSGFNQRDVVQNWRKPLLVLHAADDAFVSEDYLRSLQMPGDGTGPTLRVLKEAGHAPFLEVSGLFNDILLAFCKRGFA